MAFIPDKAQPIEVINPREAELRQVSGGFLSDGRTAPEAAMVDTEGRAPVASPLKFVPDKPPAAEPSKETTMGDVAKGVGDAALSGASKVATGMVGAPVAIVNRLIAALTGGDPQMAADAAHDYVNSHFGHDTTTPIGQNIGGVVSSALAPLGRSAQADSELLQRGGEAIGIPRGETHGALSELGDIAGTAGVATPLAAGARASTEAATLAAQNAPTAVTKYGMRTLSDHPIAAGAAGPSGPQAVALHNQPLGNTVLGAEAGVSHGTRLNPDTLATGRAAPGAVYQRMENSLPTAPLGPNAAGMVQSAGTSANVLTQPSEATQATINAQKARLLQGPLTGPEVVQTGRALRQEGATRLGSDDVEQHNLGRAQLDMAKALEQHMEDALPPGADVSPEQFQAARTAYAKNMAVQGALRGGNVDMHAIARIQRNDPGLLTGPMAHIADFANDHPAVTRLTNAVEVPPSIQNDFGKAIGTGSHQGAIDRLFGASGIPTIARRILTGGPDTAMATARQTPVSGLAGEFAPLTPDELPMQPSPGQAFSSHQPDLATGATPQRDFFGFGAGGMTADTPVVPPAAPHSGGINLADVLSHGVEQPPAEGLSLGPMGAPPQHGIPFAVNAEHAAGGLQLAPDSEPILADQLTGSGRPITALRDMSLSPQMRALESERAHSLRAREEGFEPEFEPEVIPRRAAEHEGEAARRMADEPEIEQPTWSDLLTGPSDLPGVMSQGVPEGVMQRQAKAFKRNKRDTAHFNLSDYLANQGG